MKATFAPPKASKPEKFKENRSQILVCGIISQKTVNSKYQGKIWIVLHLA